LFNREESEAKRSDKINVENGIMLLQRSYGDAGVARKNLTGYDIRPERKVTNPCGPIPKNWLR
jgi:hypothetical protein